MTSFPSPAQQRVRHHTHDLLTRHTPPFHMYGTPPDPALSELRARLAADPVIQSDPLLSWPLSKVRHSDTYLDLLIGSGSHTTSHHLQLRPMDFQPYLLDRHKQDNPVYRGNIARRPNVTMNVLVGLCQNKRIVGKDFDAYVCPAVGLIWTGNGGVHRLLGHLLWGASVFDMQDARFHMLSTPFDPELDRAYGLLERQVPSLLVEQRTFEPLDRFSPEITDFLAWEHRQEVWNAVSTATRYGWPHRYVTWAGLHHLLGEVANALDGRPVRDKETARFLRDQGVLRSSVLTRLLDGSF